jgi:hypothetical protein
MYNGTTNLYSKLAVCRFNSIDKIAITEIAETITKETISNFFDTFVCFQ